MSEVLERFLSPSLNISFLNWSMSYYSFSFTINIDWCRWLSIRVSWILLIVFIFRVFALIWFSVVAIRLIKLFFLASCIGCIWVTE